MWVYRLYPCKGENAGPDSIDEGIWVRSFTTQKISWDGIIYSLDVVLGAPLYTSTQLLSISIARYTLLQLRRSLGVKVLVAHVVGMLVV